MKIAVMGYGTIGSGVVEVLEVNKDLIAERAGEPVEVKYILDLRDFPGDPYEKCIVHDYQTIVNDPEIGIVVEAMGGVEPAYTFVKAMLLAGKQVTTSNKNLVAEKGAELIAIARERNLNFMFGASVGGGIPIIRPLNTCLTADEIEEITGILNGTTNYMLTRMANEGVSFEDVLKDAQAKGYAEADPTADVEGIDPCRKIAILTSLVCGKQVNYEDIYTEGITKITSEDFAYANKMKRSIKLLASSKQAGDKYACMVAPFMLAKSHPLCNVNDVFNSVFVRGNMLGDAMFYGSGAGKLPTASAVVADIVDMVKHNNINVFIDWSPEKMELVDYKENVNSFFVRTTSEKAEVEAAFGAVEYVEGVVEGEIGFVTNAMTEADFAEKVEKVQCISRIRLA
ncbi:MAG: homoserine dehydrogenase [Agathobacter sp.]|nr:homoserine dehydrogenase [Agathobacter sp.]